MKLKTPLSKLPRAIFAVFILIYMLLLVLAALDIPVRPQFLNEAHYFAKNLLKKAQIRSGFPVFRYSNHDYWKLNKLCIAAVGHGQSKDDLLYRTPPEVCLDFPIRWRLDNYHAWQLRIIHLHSITPPLRPHRSRDLFGLARFYCYSSFAGHGKYDSVSIIRLLRFIDYRTGAKENHLNIFMNYNCRSGMEGHPPKPENQIVSLAYPIDEGARASSAGERR